MANALVRLPLDGPGKALDAELLEILIEGVLTQVHRNRNQIVGAVADAIAAVLNEAPAGDAWGLVVRPIPSGTQTVAGTVALDAPTLTALETVNVGNFPVEGALTDAQLRGSPVPVIGPAAHPA